MPDDSPGDCGQYAAAIAKLSDRFGPRLSTSAAIRDQHGRDEAHAPPAAPDAVAFPETTAEVAALVRICAEHRCPIIPFGVGTSLEAQVIPYDGGVSVDFSRMNAVLAVNHEDLDAVVQPGVTRTQLNDALRGSGLMFTVDPGADATLGGMAGTRASGTNAVRYGTMREVTLGLEVVLADGRVIRTGSRARKSSSGYDLTKLMVGAEGTLGLITELTVRLAGVPERIAAASCAFPSVNAAVATVIALTQMGVPMARIELIDALQIRGVNAYSGLSLPEAPHLFLEFHGAEAAVSEQVALVRDLASDQGASDFKWADREEDRRRLWQARHNAYYAARALRPGAEGYVTDACVPISQLSACIDETIEDLKSSPLMAPLVGHVGDGNFHLSILIDPAAPEETAEAKRIADRVADRALRLGGTITGEHGVGRGKLGLMAREHGAAWDVMADIKRALDPLNILNPGKVVDVSSGAHGG